MIKILLNLLLIFALVLPDAWAVTDFVCTSGNGASEDYDDVGLWEAAMDNAIDLTDTDRVLVGNYDTVVGGDIADAASVNWDAATRGTMIHMTETQFLIRTSFSDQGNLHDNDVVDDGAGNGFTVMGEPTDANLVLQLFNDDGTFTGNYTIDGLTTDATHSLNLTTTTAERHDGTEGSGVVFDPSAAGHIFTVNDANFHVEWFEVTGTQGSSDECFRIAADGFTADNMIVHSLTNAFGDGFYTTTDNITIFVRNTLFYDISRTSCMVQGASNINWFTYNLTGYKMLQDGDGSSNEYGAIGFDSTATNTSSEMECINVYMDHTGSGDINDASFNVGGAGGGTFSANSDYNSDNDQDSNDTAPGANSRHNDSVAQAAFTSITAGSEDLHISAGSVLADAGLDINGSALIDIDGQDRADAVAWDIGAHELELPIVSAETAINTATLQGATIN